jgi:hypothetical protein
MNPLRNLTDDELKQRMKDAEQDLKAVKRRAKEMVEKAHDAVSELWNESVERKNMCDFCKKVVHEDDMEQHTKESHAVEQTEGGNMKIIIAAILALIAVSGARAQTQTDTTCSSAGGVLSCTSTTSPPPGALTPEQQAQQDANVKAAHDTAQHVVFNLFWRHKVNNYCKKNPDGTYQTLTTSISCADWNKK